MGGVETTQIDRVGYIVHGSTGEVMSCHVASCHVARGPKRCAQGKLWAERKQHKDTQERDTRATTDWLTGAELQNTHKMRPGPSFHQVRGATCNQPDVLNIHGNSLNI